MERFACQKCPKSFVHKCHLYRHRMIHEKAEYACQHCGKTFHRPDVLAKHQVKCTEPKTCVECRKVFSQKCSFTRHKKICAVKQIEKKVKKATEEYLEKLRKGEILEKILQQCPGTMEEALYSHDMNALKAYQSSCEDSLNMDSIVLKPWQTDVLKLIENPSDRDIYWINGDKGNEGKTFIQKYIRTQYGARRVLKSEVNTRKTDIAYVLAQETLTCKDIFLFNMLRSDTEVAYGILENIKDGYLMSSKYRSKAIKIKTPNTVMVFSNSFPQTNQLSEDRWKIYHIREDKLHEAERMRDGTFRTLYYP